MSKESEEYERAKAECVAEIMQGMREAFYREVARVFFGGTPEQQEETYQRLMSYEASTLD